MIKQSIFTAQLGVGEAGNEWMKYIHNWFPCTRHHGSHWDCDI